MIFLQLCKLFKDKFLCCFRTVSAMLDGPSFVLFFYLIAKKVESQDERYDDDLFYCRYEWRCKCSNCHEWAKLVWKMRDRIPLSYYYCVCFGRLGLWGHVLEKVLQRMIRIGESNPRRILGFTIALTNIILSLVGRKPQMFGRWKSQNRQNLG